MGAMPVGCYKQMGVIMRLQCIFHLLGWLHNIDEIGQLIASMNEY